MPCYIITRHTCNGHAAGYVRRQDDYRKAAKFKTYRAAMTVARELNRTDPRLCYNVDLAIGHDCGQLFADERIIHA